MGGSSISIGRGVVTTVGMATMATGATPTDIPARLLNDHTRTSHTHARDILGVVHRHAVPIGLARVRAVHSRIPVRVYDLLLGLDVHRHGLRVPVLSGLHV